MKRRPLLILLLLLGGVIVNVAVAWACFCACTKLNSKDVAASTVPPFVRQWPSGWADRDDLVMESRQFGFEWYFAIGNFSDEPPPSGILANQQLELLRVGWPAMSLQRSMSSAYRSTDHERPWSGSVRIGRRLMPAMPVPFGFAVNTVFCAFTLWLLFAGPFVVRRWRRIRRGLCPKCAYDLRGTEANVCPECGAQK